MKKFARIMAMLLCLAMVASMFAGCSQADKQPDATATVPPTADSEAPGVDASYLDNEPLRIGTMAHQMGVFIYYADKHGLFNDAGINVARAIFSGGAAVNEAFGAGELDGAISGLASVYALANNLVKMVGEVDILNSIRLSKRYLDNYLT